MAVDDLPGPVANPLNVLDIPWPYAGLEAVGYLHRGPEAGCHRAADRDGDRAVGAGLVPVRREGLGPVDWVSVDAGAVYAQAAKLRSQAAALSKQAEGLSAGVQGLKF